MTDRYQSAWNELKSGKTLILDAGISSELERRGAPMTDGVWSGRTGFDHWETLVRVHMDYIEAGADIITTNTFASARVVLEATGLGEMVREINVRTIEAALEARERAGRADVLVAGSMSHMFPIFADGTRPGDGKPPAMEFAGEAFRELAAIHREAGSDFLLLEMMYVPERMTAMFDAVADAGLPVWCGLSAIRGDDGTITSTWDVEKIPITDTIAMAEARNFDVLGMMHTRADLITETLPLLRGVHAGPLMVYPDCGYFKMPHWHFVDVMSPQEFAGFATTWKEAGVQVIGGCCGLGPEHIAAIRHLK